jgi:parallel beta helix pectate lyase-like protein
VIDVNKRVTLESSAGAAATIIDGGTGGSGQPSDVLRVTASGAVIGRRDRGFTVRGGSVGIGVDDTVAAVRIEGNVVIRSGVGVGTGAPDTVITGNVVRDATLFGVFVGGARTTVSGNVVARNSGFGMFLVPTTVSNNFVVGNVDGGLIVLPGPAEIRQNTITGQLGRGVDFGSGAPGAYAGLVFTGNNIFANGTAPATNCGADSEHNEVIKAERNYWGSASGPGPDPADQACNLFDTTPFATRAFAIVNTAGR